MRRQLVRQYAVKTPKLDTPIKNLSGGNIQKVIMARELSRKPGVLIAAQPTRGVDIGASEYIHQQLLEQRAGGIAILLISEDLDEVRSLSDRIAVMYEGRIMGILDRNEATVEKLGLMMAGISATEPATAASNHRGVKRMELTTVSAVGQRAQIAEIKDRIEYTRAENVAHAVNLLNQPGVRSRVLAGGTDLVLLMREERDLCDRVVDVTLTPELHEIRLEGDVVTIGAAASFAEIIDSPVVRETAPLLVEACHSVGAPQIRNMGTLGGNVANAAACADSLPALVCLDAVAHALTPAGALQWPVSKLVIRPNQTKLPHGALLTSLSYRVPPAGSRGVFLKLGRRNALAISRLTVAALGRVDEAGKVVEIRLVPGSATPQIRRFPQAEAHLMGQTPSVVLCEEAARVAVQEMLEITGKRWSSEFKEPALFSMVAHALLQVFNVAGNGRAV